MVVEKWGYKGKLYLTTDIWIKMLTISNSPSRECERSTSAEKWYTTHVKQGDTLAKTQRSPFEKSPRGLISIGSWLAPQGVWACLHRKMESCGGLDAGAICGLRNLSGSNGSQLGLGTGSPEDLVQILTSGLYSLRFWFNRSEVQFAQQCF